MKSLVFVLFSAYAMLILSSNLASLDYESILTLPLESFLDQHQRYTPIFKKFKGEACNPKSFQRSKSLGKGASGRVYLARHTSGALAAIKRISLSGVSYSEIVTTEVILHKLEHENLTKGMCTFRGKKYVYIAMHYETEKTMNELIEEGVSMPDLRSFALQLVNVLEYLHGRGIIHHDIKPSNVLVLEDGRIRLIDFGAAQYHHVSAVPQSGTPIYMPPEKLKSEQFDDGVDWYSMGLTLLEVYNREHPYRLAMQSDDILDWIKDEYLPIDDPVLGDLVRNLCHKDRTKRWSHANKRILHIRGHEFFLE